jgi:hypothetical protein
MAVKTNYNVKVRLDNENFPTTNQTVIWDPNSGSFEITASSALGGNQNLQEVTDVGEVTTNASYFLNGQSLGYGGLTNQDATSGFIELGGLAYTHVTPQSVNKQISLLGFQFEQIETNTTAFDYPDNYLAYNGGAILTPDTSGTSGTSGGGTDSSYECTSRYANTSNSENKLFLATVSINDTITISTNVLINDTGYTPTEDDIVLLEPDNAPTNLNYVVATVATVTGGLGNTTFTVTDVVWDGSSTNGPFHIWCISLMALTSLTLELGGGNELGQIALMRAASGSEGTGSEDPRSGMLLTSAGNIFYFKPDAKRNASGSFQIPSASAKISFNAGDSSIDFKINGDSDPSAIYKPILYISKSGDDARIGIGTTNPIQAFDVQETKNDSTGTQLLLRSARTATKGADPGDAAGSINFIIASGSYNNLLESGSVAKITTDVRGVSDVGVVGDLPLPNRN